MGSYFFFAALSQPRTTGANVTQFVMTASDDAIEKAVVAAREAQLSNKTAAAAARASARKRRAVEAAEASTEEWSLPLGCKRPPNLRNSGRFACCFSACPALLRSKEGWERHVRTCPLGGYSSPLMPRANFIQPQFQ